MTNDAFETVGGRGGFDTFVSDGVMCLTSETHRASGLGQRWQPTSTYLVVARQFVAQAIDTGPLRCYVISSYSLMIH